MKEIPRVGVDLIKEIESFSSVVYLCPAGLRTIGYGEVVGKDTPLTVTHEIAEQRLIAHAMEDWKCILFAVRVEQTENQYGALLSFVYNNGRGNFENSTLLKKINAKAPLEEIEAEFMRWVYITDPATKKKIKSKGLQRRRAAECMLYKSEGPVSISTIRSKAWKVF